MVVCVNYIKATKALYSFHEGYVTLVSLVSFLFDEMGIWLFA
jgi:hypothetical protein